ncbi:MAG: transcriptional repressor LexA [Alphaproteobacteria bacterium]
MLTQKQHQLLIYINNHLKQFGISPSFEEMKNALNLHSKSGIHRLISALEERGFIRKLPNKARALEILKMPENFQQQNNFTNLAEVKKAKALIGKETNLMSEEATTVNLPLYGKIAAGTPIEALRNDNDMVSVSPHMVGAGEHYALTVEGDSMIEAGIFDGDTVIIKKCENAENGTIVVALVDSSEVTLKRIRRKGDSIALEPANPQYKTRILGPDRIAVQGRLVGLMRTYN